MTITLLLTLHPFNGTSLYILIFFSFIFQLFTKRDKEETKWFTLLTLIQLYFILYYNIILPGASKDAYFQRWVFFKVGFRLSPEVYFQYLLPPILVLFISIYKNIAELKKNRNFWIFLGGAISYIIISNSYFFTNIVPQPAHWSRAYPYIFLVVASSYAKKIDNKRRKLILTIILISIIDSYYGLITIAKHLKENPGAPYQLNTNQAQVINILHKVTSGKLAYIRDCDRKINHGDFEYSITALTSHTTIYSHWYFSPFLKTLQPLFCDNKGGIKNNTKNEQREKILNSLDLIIIDSWLMPHELESLSFSLNGCNQEYCLWVKNRSK